MKIPNLSSCRWPHENTSSKQTNQLTSREWTWKSKKPHKLKKVCQNSSKNIKVQPKNYLPEFDQIMIIWSLVINIFVKVWKESSEEIESICIDDFNKNKEETVVKKYEILLFDVKALYSSIKREVAVAVQEHEIPGHEK